MPPRGNLLSDKRKVDAVVRLLDVGNPPLEQFVKTRPGHDDVVKSVCPAVEPV
ncbi:hypothetical protein ABI_04710 [Asticcacaulis biprosthecium C19]|uniref:Uncharacterized protein n=1 Tax=Asticcacaulis biprosthecium C19 TaxID=715226 RepID=F4QK12_9CAUL|nr:hypothetical protein ABI_04710 [Asticcacaulis biprosthecium C19]